MFEFDTGPLEQVEAVGDAIKLVEDHSADAGLDDELGALQAGGGGDVEGGTFGGIVGTRHLCDRVGLGMEHIGLGEAVGILAHIFKAGRGAVVAVGDNHGVLHQQGTHFAPLAIGVLGPNGGHAQIAPVDSVLFVVLFHHLPFNAQIYEEKTKICNKSMRNRLTTLQEGFCNNVAKMETKLLQTFVIEKFGV